MATIKTMPMPSNIGFLHPISASIGALTNDCKRSAFRALFAKYDWRRQSFFNGPTLADARGQSRLFDAKLISPLGDSQRLTAEGQSNVIRPIILLFLHGGPAAILLTIAFGVINPVKSEVASRLSLHVISEIFVSMPAVTNGYSFGTIFGIAAICCLVASPHHGTPRFVKFGSDLTAFTMAQIKLTYALCVRLSVQAATRLCIAIAQSLTPRQGFISAIATTTPSRHVVFGIWSALNNEQTAKAGTREINECWHINKLSLAGSIIKEKSNGI